jgi:putative ATP-dependent endonuclease of the OLD family
MRLTRVFIENFRGIRQLNLKLDLITVLIGENNHGKTSVFDALCVCLGRPGSAIPTRFRAVDFHDSHRMGGPRSIRVALTFESSDTRMIPAGSPLQCALTRDRDGVERLRVEFWGRPGDRRVEHRFVDEVGRPLEPAPPASTIEELRRLHPVLLLRFAQRAPADGPPDPVTREGDAHRELRGRLDLESRVADVYHELAHTRGPVSTKDLDRGLAAAETLYEGIRSRWVATRGAKNADRDLSGEDSAVTGNPRVLGDPGGGSHTLGVLMVLGAMLDVRGDTLLPADSDPVIAIEEPEVHMHPILLASTWDVIEGLGAQTLVTTNSGELLSSVPMHSLRRLVRKNGQISVNRLNPTRLSDTELRRVGYHIRAKRGAVLFARCWLLVEGESEFWLLRQLAHVLGLDLEAEGVRCVEFAQCGVAPLVKLANDLGIEWHLLVDGDESGLAYTRDAEQHIKRTAKAERITLLKHRDIERCLWHHGFADVYHLAAGLEGTAGKRGDKSPPGKVIAKAVRKHSKPYLALTVAEAAAERGPASVPETLREVIEKAIALARKTTLEQ